MPEVRGGSREGSPQAVTREAGGNADGYLSSVRLEFTFFYVGGQERALCDDCKNRKGGRPKPLPKKRKKKRGPTLAELERAAREMGMSYGKYKAWLDSQKQKGAKKS